MRKRAKEKKVNAWLEKIAAEEQLATCDATANAKEGHIALAGGWCSVRGWAGARLCRRSLCEWAHLGSTSGIGGWHACRELHLNALQR